MLVYTEPIEPRRLRELELVQELVIEVRGPLRIEQAMGHVHPHRAISLLEVVGEEAVWHEMEEADFHRASGGRE
jgi:hypothetical protein